MNADFEIRRIADRLSTAKCALAVFLVGDMLRPSKVTSDLCKKMMHRNPGKLMGIYDGACRYEWLREDLAYFSRRVGR